MKVEFMIHDPILEAALKEIALEKSKANPPELDTSELCSELVNSHPEVQDMLDKFAEAMTTPPDSE